MKQPHHDAFTLKQEILERVKRLHKKCGFLDIEHLLMIPINWLNHREFPDVNVDILENFYNAFRTPTYFFAEKYFESWDPKIHGICNYFQSFYVDALIDKCGNMKNYPLAMYQNGISKETRSSVTVKMELLFHPLILPLHPREIKINVMLLISK